MTTSIFGHNEFFYTAVPDEDGDIIIYESQGGFPARYQDIADAVETMLLYLDLGKEYVDAIHKEGLDEKLNHRYEPQPKKVVIPPKPRAGYVYLIKSPSSSYKIGRTIDPDNRMKVFSVKLPFEVEYVALIQTDDMKTLETSLHQRFAHLHINGEWFALTPADVEYIKGLAS